MQSVFRAILVVLASLVCFYLLGPTNLVAAEQVPGSTSEAAATPAVSQPVEPEATPEGSPPPLSVAETAEEESGLLVKWLHMLDKDDTSDLESSGVVAFAPRVPGDLLRIVRAIGGDKGVWGFFVVLFLTALSFGIGFLGVLISKRFTRKARAQLQRITPPEDTPLIRVWLGFLSNLSSLAGMIVLAIVSTLAFLIIGNSVSVEGRMLFQLLLGTLLIIILCSFIASILFAPEESGNRPFELDDELAQVLHRTFTIAFTVILSGLLFLRFFTEVGAQPQTVSWIAILLGTAVIAVFVYLTLFLRIPVADVLQKSRRGKPSSWLKGQVLAYWHVPVLLYLFLAWFMWVGQEMTGTSARNGSFIISLIIIPFYFLSSKVGKNIISGVVDSLGIGSQQESDPLQEDYVVDEQELEARRLDIINRAHTIFNVVLAVTLATWLLSLWGFNLPFAEVAMKALFQSLVIIVLAILFWRFASAYIQRKIDEATPEQIEQEEDIDDEFGGAAPRGRSHTLLPMLRKVVGTVLVTVVLLTIISALGVNIGPLLAGAGVLGLAIGFGAQKLVSDVLSGFFFLLDDAFRVGEYIQAGSIRGTVEAITLRNVMLRHHLGMLQIVPHSDLGAVTNYMRGGIVIKFPLEFPYDTNIDQVRKIIKKVGQAMLEDEELGDDFIKPIKSQGVSEITNSVMVIRVKFTAKPGTQFLIRREAYRRITEALNAKGIYYAHRKVIVDLPEETQQKLSGDAQKAILEAGGGAAAAQAAAEEQAAQQKSE